MSIKSLVRRVIKAKKDETISDALQRRKYHILRRFNHKTFDSEELKKSLVELGLKQGDTVIVHCAYRSFVGYNSGPESVIQTIYDIVAPDGTILSPAFTSTKKSFDKKMPTAAGVISSLLLKLDKCERSVNNVFSMVAIGKKSKELTVDHINCTYAFDEHSPYSKAIDDKAKILLLGLGKKPHKISLFHCLTYSLKDQLSCYKEVYNNNGFYDYTNEYGETVKIEYRDRNNNIQNCKRRFKKLFNKFINKESYKRINFLDIYLFDASDMYRKCKNYIVNKNYFIYKVKKC